MSKYLFLLLFSVSTFASELDLFKQNDEDLCIYNPKSQTTSLAEAALKYGSSYCQEYSNDMIFEAQMGCLKGHWKTLRNKVTTFGDVVRFVLIDNPVYDLYKMAFFEFAKIAKGEYSPSDLANQYANQNIRSQAELWNQSRKYLQQMKAFAVDFKNELTLNIENFSCLPLEKKSEIICRGLSEVFLFFVSPQRYVNGAKWGVEHVKALRAFIVETKKINGLENMSVAQRLNLATKALKETKGAAEILKLRNGRIIEEALPNGEKILKYEYAVKASDGKLHTITREVAVDSNTHAINAKVGIGKEVLSELVKAQQGAGTAIFVDVNHLGKANYFKGNDVIKGATQGGDMYLANAAEEIRKNLRPGDMLFKNGGDEFVVILGTNNPKTVKDISQRIVNSVDQNKQIKQFFKLQVTNVAERYREINKATKLSDLPESTVSKFTAEELEAAKKNFHLFAEVKKAELKTALQEQASYRGSISIGSSRIRHNDTIETSLERAESQASIVKARYKARYGQDVSKYQVEGLESGGRRYGPPEALEPD